MKIKISYQTLQDIIHFNDIDNEHQDLMNNREIQQEEIEKHWEKVTEKALDLAYGIKEDIENQDLSESELD